MKLKSGLILREVDGQAVVVPIGERSRTFQGMIQLNPSGAFLWETFAAAGETSIAALTAAMCEAYDVTSEVAEADVRAFVGALQGADLLEGDLD